MTVQRVETGYRPRPLQAEVHRSLKRWNVLVCHRRFGKTVLAVNELIDQALRCRLTRPRYAYVAPYFVQAKSVAWDYVKAYTSAIPGVEKNESELRVDLPNGARISLYGADNPDRLRGLYFDGVVLDETADMPAALLPEVVRPALADRKGFLIAIGTPKGRNGFWQLYDEATRDPAWYAAMFRASETALIDPDELAAARRAMTPEQYDQEFECSFQAAIMGAYYGTLLNDADREGRICNVPWEQAKQVETWWDLGVGDSTVVWFAQRVGQEVRLIDYYEMTGEGLPHFVKVLREKPYVYSQHIAPHDITVRELGTGKSRLETARELGINYTVAPRLGVDDGIDAARMMLPKCWFDAEKCKQGLEALRQYRKDWDDRLKVFRDHPRHDWASHAADAFRYGAIAAPPTTDWGGDLKYQKLGIV